jgi:predicted RNA-binding protein associated with RNAse of E/G family
MKPSNYSPGNVIVLREIWAAKIWTARPVIVVRDDNDLIALHVAANTRWKHHQGKNGSYITPDERKNGTWTLQDAVWNSDHGYLKLAVPGESYSVLLFWNSSYNNFRQWYINLEDPEQPMHRTAIGFDCTDQVLDLIIQPDLKSWRWEDEDELSETVEAGLISSVKASQLYAKGSEARDLIMSGKSIYNGWEHWRPAPSWQTPALSSGWDIL